MLLVKIKEDSITARKAGSAQAAKAALLVTLYSEAAMVGKNAANRESSDEEVIAVIKKFLKGVNESLAVQPLNEKLQAEKAILEGYLPQQMDSNALIAAMQEIIAKEGLSKDAKATGLVMKSLKAQYAGLYDGAMASKLLKELLSA